MVEGKVNMAETSDASMMMPPHLSKYIWSEAGVFGKCRKREGGQPARPLAALPGLCGAASGPGRERRIRSRMQNLPLQKEIREDGARLGKFGMRVKCVRNAGEGVQL